MRLGIDSGNPPVVSENLLRIGISFRRSRITTPTTCANTSPGSTRRCGRGRVAQRLTARARFDRWPASALVLWG